MQFVSPSSTVTLDLHRFYQPTVTSRFQTTGAKDLQVSFDQASLQLQIRVEPAAHGLIDLPFQVNDGAESKEGVITLAVRSPQAHEFVYHPAGKPATVTVGGSFNGWSKEATPPRVDESGVYRVTVPLEPGSYSYKFIVDDRWTTDPDNPIHEPDGFGGNNSLLKVEARASGGSRFSIYADQLAPDRLLIHSAGAGEIRSTSVVAELPDGSTRLLPAAVTSSEINVPFAELPAATWVRVIAADATGQASNVVCCSLGEAKTFRWQDAIMYYALTDRFWNEQRSSN
ncbi:MAG: glycogen-binding domain-containing protein [Chthoniobacterales bacterium]